MPDSRFPKNAVAVKDVLKKLNLPGENLYAYFTFSPYSTDKCSTIERVVLGPDRDQVEKYQEKYPTYRKQPHFSGTSRIGFGPVVVLDKNGRPTVQQERMLIYISATKDVEGEKGQQAATNLSISLVLADLGDEEEKRATAEKNKCLASMTPENKKKIRELDGGDEPR